MICLNSVLWQELVTTLRLRGKGIQESGAFLLGNVIDEKRFVRSFVMYDDLFPRAFSRQRIYLPSEAYHQLWRICNQRSQRVVADIHTHPKDAFFSITDRQHPMIPEIGHTAIVLPNYAHGEFSLTELGLYVYQGSFKWHEYSGSKILRQLILTDEKNP